MAKKGAQLGWSELVINRTLFSLDIKRESVLYLLPTKTPDAKDFSVTRFDVALQLSQYLNDMFVDVKNIGLKKSISGACLYIRGTRSSSGLKSIPVAGIVMDEYQEMTYKNVALARERQSGQKQEDKWEWNISTPGAEGTGIDKEYEPSDQKEFHFKCPSCSRFITINYPESIVETADRLDDPRIEESHYICTKCKNKLPQETKPLYLANWEWVPKFAGRDVSGYWINQLYSTTVGPVDLVKQIIKARFDPSDEQELYNSKIGLSKTVDGALITEQDILNCAAGYQIPVLDFNSSKIRTAGIDVGKVIHYVITEWEIRGNISQQAQSIPRILAMGSVPDFNKMKEVLRTFSPRAVVIDAQPERHAAYQFVLSLPCEARMCFYGEGMSAKQINISENDINEEPTVSVDRSSWLDLSQGRIRKGTIRLPTNVTEEFKHHVRALVRLPKKDKFGHTIFRYEQIAERPDHLAHALNYNEVAFALVQGAGHYSNIAV